jgi:hypothetical protein
MISKIMRKYYKKYGKEGLQLLSKSFQNLDKLFSINFNRQIFGNCGKIKKKNAH